MSVAARLLGQDVKIEHPVGHVEHDERHGEGHARDLVHATGVAEAGPLDGGGRVLSLLFGGLGGLFVLRHRVESVDHSFRDLEVGGDDILEREKNDVCQS